MQLRAKLRKGNIIIIVVVINTKNVLVLITLKGLLELIHGFHLRYNIIFKTFNNAARLQYSNKIILGIIKRI